MGVDPYDLGNSIASVIANEFTEATYDLYLSALVELGLVLLLVSVIVNTLARLLLRRVRTERTSRLAFAPGGTINGPRPMTRYPAGAKGTAPRRLGYGGTAGGTRQAPLDQSAHDGGVGLCWHSRWVLFLILGHLIYQGVAPLTGISS